METARALDSKPLIYSLVAVTFGLLTINIVAKVIMHPIDSGGFWLGNFDVNGEGNIPTIWNGTLLLGIAFLCLSMAVLIPTNRLGWIAASLTSGLMAADEMLRWHERLGSVGSAISSALGFTIPTYAWLLPGTAFAVGLLALVGLWVRQLPPRVRRGVIAGASMYVLGALGAEAVSGWIDRLYGIGHAYNAITATEEGLEMLGCIVVVAALLRLVSVVDDETVGRSVSVAAD